MRLQFIHNLSCSIISGEFVKWRFYQEGRDGAQVSWIVDEDSVQIHWWRERGEAGQAVQDLPAVPEISKTEDDFEVSMVDIVCIVFVFHTQNIKNYKDCFIFGMGNIYCASHMQECNNATVHALSPTF